MTPSSFLEHWGILENPFRGEEARQDAVLARLVAAARRPGAAHGPGSASGSSVNGAIADVGSGALAGSISGDAGLAAVSSSLAARAQHSDCEKVVGDLGRPASSVVFGEKGSGKTALRVQIQHAAALHNAAHPNDKTLLISNDDLTPFLERLHARLVRQTRKGPTSPADSFKLTRLVDHVDALLNLAVPSLVDALLENNASPMPTGDPSHLDLGPEPRRTARAFDRQTKRDLLLLQAVYDRAEASGERSRLFRRAVGVHRPIADRIEWGVARFGWVVPIGTLVYVYQTRNRAAAPGYADSSTGFLGWREWWGSFSLTDSAQVAWTTFFTASLLIWLIFALKRWWTNRIMFNRFTRRVFKQVRVTGRSERSFAGSLHELPTGWRGGGVLPLTDADATRFAMLQRFRRVLKPYGYTSMLVVIDRVDEPALIAGDVERMRSVVWPLLNNSYLQQEGVASKLLLPIELRHALMRESAAFFQQARMDKQNMVEQLAWTGPMLYDLCDTRLAACRAAAMTGGSTPAMPAITLGDLFAADVPREMIVESLEQMRQPRDAFKLVYQCIADHCATTSAAGNTSDNPHAGYQISRAVLESARKAQIERVRQLAMGIRPA